LVALHELSRFRQAHRWNRFIVLHDQLDLSASRAIANLVQIEKEPVQNVAAVLRAAAGQRHHEPDLDRGLSLSE
jgi:hypothetical protein